jgi:hypothetical protein
VADTSRQRRTALAVVAVAHSTDATVDEDASCSSSSRAEDGHQRKAAAAATPTGGGDREPQGTEPAEPAERGTSAALEGRASSSRELELEARVLGLEADLKRLLATHVRTTIAIAQLEEHGVEQAQAHEREKAMLLRQVQSLSESAATRAESTGGGSSSSSCSRTAGAITVTFSPANAWH